MAKKIDKAAAERAAALGIKKVKDEEELRTKLLAILAENDIDGMEDEDTDSLFDMVESMVGGSDEAEEADDDNEADELAEEVEDDDEEDDEADEAEEDDDEEDDEAEEKPEPKKSEKKSASKKEDSKPAKKAEKKQPSKRGVKLDPKNNKDDRKVFKFLEKFFPTDKYEYCWIVMNGVTIKFKGSNSSRAVLSLEVCTKKEDNSITCNAFFLTFNKSLNVLDDADIDYKICWNGAPYLKGITFDELSEIIETLLPEMEKFVEKIDKRLGDNRKKMEESLKKTTKKDKPASKKPAKVEEPEVDDEEDDEDEDEAPSKKPAKKAEKKPAKKGKK